MMHRPGLNNSWGSAFTYMAVNAGFQSYLASRYAPGGEVTSKPYKYDPKNERALDIELKELIKNGEGFNYFERAPFPATREQVSRVLLNSNGDLVGAVGKTLFGQHTSIVLADIPSITGKIDLAHFPNLRDLYGLWGISHQAVNVSLLETGYSSTVMSVGGGWTTAVSTVVYGHYGGGAAGSAAFYKEFSK